MSKPINVYFTYAFCLSNENNLQRSSIEFTSIRHVFFFKNFFFTGSLVRNYIINSTNCKIKH